MGQTKTAVNPLAQAMSSNNTSPETGSNNTDTQPDVNSFAAALGNAQASSENNNTFNKNSKLPGTEFNGKARFDSPKTQKEILAEQEEAKKLEAHQAALTAENKQKVIFDGKIAEDKKNETLVRADLNKLIGKNKEVTIGRNEIYTAFNGSLKKSGRSIEDGGGKGWKNFFTKLTTEIQQLQKRIKSAKNLDWNGASKAKAKKKKGPGAEMAGAEMAGATNTREIRTAIHADNHENGAGGE